MGPGMLSLLAIWCQCLHGQFESRCSPAAAQTSCKSVCGLGSQAMVIREDASWNDSWAWLHPAKCWPKYQGMLKQVKHGYKAVNTDTNAICMSLLARQLRSRYHHLPAAGAVIKLKLDVEAYNACLQILLWSKCQEISSIGQAGQEAAQEGPRQDGG